MCGVVSGAALVRKGRRGGFQMMAGTVYGCCAMHCRPDDKERRNQKITGYVNSFSLFSHSPSNHPALKNRL